MARKINFGAYNKYVVYSTIETRKHRGSDVCVFRFDNGYGARVSKPGEWDNNGSVIFIRMKKIKAWFDK